VSEDEDEGSLLESNEGMIVAVQLGDLDIVGIGDG